ncbi:carbamoyltransferase C-terminal domain-containing protein [Amycolatopsis keratiniphila]|uniref:carbamoyltransferase C-terminal domain-containing protein n=1 Tax=Amycolatopsis keratiniphila TaxID=129921 RepID=UPI00087A98C5|nr:carbamoyltransferase C-terminal domain-containing protein [Amycolatopsis keratiniphila]OLZ58334.1 proline dehydrogenase [Amycolatopsis keratiniphila subsp. nogabecina]SDU28386.1 hydroxymethyl cephem carbamoyltransferase [Amycolatopsis keratiniphila]
MLILSMKEGHDGGIVAIEDGKLLFALESEKDNYPRYDRITGELMARAAGMLDKQPDVVALGGWVKGEFSVEPPSRTGYFGVGEGAISDEAGKFFGKDVRYFSSTHERSHIYTSLGMAPAAPGQAYYSLVWEGNIGDFYRIDERGEATHLQHVLTDPGAKYAYLFALADPGFPLGKGKFRFNDAGKQMALTGFAEQGPLTPDEQKTIDFILDRDGIILGLSKEEMSWSHLYNAGVWSQEYRNAAAKHSQAIFNRFYDYAEKNLTEGLPLLISGGCGLNCDWNRLWRESGLFSSVFVPPCPNDSGSALGTAIDAQWFYTGQATIEWDVYAGENFVEDVVPDPAKYETRPLVASEVAKYIKDGNIIGWARGRYEMGPRALGNRSILAAPFTVDTTVRLNKIKRREDYRPIAPIALESDAPKWFVGSVQDPYMLYFNHVTSDELKAITHVDGTARTQTVTRERNAGITDLLEAFREQTGFSVLCNTSLNNNGRGFLNRTSDLIEYGETYGLDGYVINDTFVTPRTS